MPGITLGRGTPSTNGAPSGSPQIRLPGVTIGGQPGTTTAPSSDGEPAMANREWVLQEVRRIDGAIPSMTASSRPLPQHLGTGTSRAWSDPTGVRKVTLELQTPDARRQITYWIATTGNVIHASERVTSLQYRTNTERRTWYHRGAPFAMSERSVEGRVSWVPAEDARLRGASDVDHANLRDLMPLHGTTYRGQ